MGVILIRYGELFLKGDNKCYFEKVLLNNIRHSLDGFTFKLKKLQGRYLLSDFEEKNELQIINKLQKVAGLHSISSAYEMNTDIEEIKKYVGTLTFNNTTFKVIVNRADKTFDIQSTNFAAILGGVVLDNNPTAKVDVHNPQKELYVDIREHGKTYIFSDIIKCMGGMPVSTSGRGLVMISGGIDSPVAAYMMTKRGMSLSAIHFHSFPYTGVLAKEKVIKLTNIVSEYAGHINLYVVSFTKIQEAIHKNCKCEYMIIIMRRIMMRIACRLAKEKGIGGIITGESLAQVASQTIESITVTNAVATIPVLRPLIGFDKIEIMDIARKIGTYETSILPYEDCCTVFLPDHPLIKPKVRLVEEEESKLDIENLINEALSTIETIFIPVEI
ncbi:MAG: tRNA uracil 4-sulfurtransferase ThiI [Clostridia bacterium]|jgi:thiamine biosynthesis protein ThiI|nr:tRNA 4-thiouridine(8) synthase ThiI [Clostridia bacterium]